MRRTSPSTGAEVVGDHPDFACGYAAVIAAGDSRSAKQWAQAAWEGAPAALRWFIKAGWRFVLRLQLGPRGSPDHVLGWRIVEDHPDETICHARSGYLDAYNTFRRMDGSLVWSTFVTYERPMARFIWPPVSLLHRPLVRYALGRAASQA